MPRRDALGSCFAARHIATTISSRRKARSELAGAVSSRGGSNCRKAWRLFENKERNRSLYSATQLYFPLQYIKGSHHRLSSTWEEQWAIRWFCSIGCLQRPNAEHCVSDMSFESDGICTSLNRLASSLAHTVLFKKNHFGATWWRQLSRMNALGFCKNPRMPAQYQNFKRKIAP